MKFFSTWLLASTLVTFSVSGFNNYRPYISTNLAKVIMADKEEVVEEKCDGSGWITHGDGHKTECPGCSACQGNDPEPELEPESDTPEVTHRCKCDRGNRYCNCVATYGKCGCKKTEVKKKRIPRREHSETADTDDGLFQRALRFFIGR